MLCSDLSLKDLSLGQESLNSVSFASLLDAGSGEAGLLPVPHVIGTAAPAAGGPGVPRRTEKTRVRKGYSNRSSNFLADDLNRPAVGKQKLRGPSAQNLAPELMSRAIHARTGAPQEHLQPVLGNQQQRQQQQQQQQHNFPEPLAMPAPMGSHSSSWSQDRQAFGGPVLQDGSNLQKKPQYWSKEEDDTLKAAVEKHGEKMWKRIAELVPGRTSTQCIQRWKKVLKPGLKKGHWSKEEDGLLIEGVEKQLKDQAKKINWSAVSKGISKRSCKQCRERWINHLNPDVNKGDWTTAEDLKLWDLQKQTPRRWAKIARSMPGRTENMVKVRWNILNREVTKGEGELYATLVSISGNNKVASSASGSSSNGVTAPHSATKFAGASAAARNAAGVQQRPLASTKPAFEVKNEPLELPLPDPIVHANMRLVGTSKSSRTGASNVNNASDSNRSQGDGPASTRGPAGSALRTLNNQSLSELLDGSAARDLDLHTIDFDLLGVRGAPDMHLSNNNGTDQGSNFVEQQHQPILQQQQQHHHQEQHQQHVQGYSTSYSSFPGLGLNGGGVGSFTSSGAPSTSNVREFFRGTGSSHAMRVSSKNFANLFDEEFNGHNLQDITGSNNTNITSRTSTAPPQSVSNGTSAELQHPPAAPVSFGAAAFRRSFNDCQQVLPGESLLDEAPSAFEHDNIAAELQNDIKVMYSS